MKRLNTKIVKSERNSGVKPINNNVVVQTYIHCKLHRLYSNILDNLRTGLLSKHFALLIYDLGEHSGRRSETVYVFKIFFSSSSSIPPRLMTILRVLPRLYSSHRGRTGRLGYLWSADLKRNLISCRSASMTTQCVQLEFFSSCFFFLLSNVLSILGLV